MERSSPPAVGGGPARLHIAAAAVVDGRVGGEGRRVARDETWAKRRRARRRAHRLDGETVEGGREEAGGCAGSLWLWHAL